MARGSKKIGPLFPIGPQEEKTEPKTESQTTEEPKKEEPATVTVEKSVEKEKDHQPQEQTAPVADDLKAVDLKKEKEEPQVSAEESDLYSKYRKRPKYETHVPHNTRIPKELRREMERIAKKLGVPLGKNSGFFQQFTIDALWEAVKKAKKELGIDD